MLKACRNSFSGNKKSFSRKSQKMSKKKKDFLWDSKIGFTFPMVWKFFFPPWSQNWNVLGILCACQTWTINMGSTRNLCGVRSGRLMRLLKSIMTEILPVNFRSSGSLMLSCFTSLLSRKGVKVLTAIHYALLTFSDQPFFAQFFHVFSLVKRKYKSPVPPDRVHSRISSVFM